MRGTSYGERARLREGGAAEDIEGARGGVQWRRVITIGRIIIACWRNVEISIR